jgi:hypothetical protein
VEQGGDGEFLPGKGSTEADQTVSLPKPRTRRFLMAAKKKAAKKKAGKKKK